MLWYKIQISKTISCEYLQDYNQYLRIKTIELLWNREIYKYLFQKNIVIKNALTGFLHEAVF